MKSGHQGTNCDSADLLCELYSDDKGLCHHHVCDYGALCVLKGQRAVCVCPAHCPDYFQPVCSELSGCLILLTHRLIHWKLHKKLANIHTSSLMSRQLTVFSIQHIDLPLASDSLELRKQKISDNESCVKAPSRAQRCTTIGLCTHTLRLFIRQLTLASNFLQWTVKARKQEPQLPLRNRASAMHFFVAKLLSITVMTDRVRLVTSEAYVRSYMKTEFDAKQPVKVIQGHIFWGRWKSDMGLNNST